MTFEKKIHGYMCKYLEINYMQIYFALLLITLNVPQVGNPWSRHYKVVLRLAGVFAFLQTTLPLNKFAHP